MDIPVVVVELRSVRIKRETATRSGLIDNQEQHESQGENDAVARLQTMAPASAPNIHPLSTTLAGHSAIISIQLDSTRILIPVRHVTRFMK